MARRHTRVLALSVLVACLLMATACANRNLDRLVANGGTTDAGQPAGLAPGRADGDGTGAALDGGGVDGASTPDGATGGATAATAASGGATAASPSARPGASGGATSAAGGAGGASKAAAGAKRQLVLGGLYHLSGFPLGSDVLTGCYYGVTSYINDLNAKGGVNGYTFKYIAYDDGLDSQRAQALIKRLVEDDKADAILGNCSDFTLEAQLPELTKANIPVIGPVIGGNLEWYRHPNLFPVYSDQQDVGYPKYAVDQMVKAGVKKAGVLYVNVPSGSGGAAGARKYMRRAGIDIVYDSSHALTESDFTAYVSGLKSAGAEAVWFIATPDFLDKFVNAAKQQNYTGKVYAPWPGYYPEIKKVGNFVNGRYFVTMPHLGVETPRSPQGLQHFKDIMKRYAPRQSLNATAIQGFTTGEVFEEALKRMGDTPWSSDAFMNALRTFQNWEGTFNAPITYANGGNRQPTNCMQVLTADTSAPSGWKVLGPPLQCKTVFD